MIHSFSFLDFQSKEEPFNQGVKVQKIGKLDGRKEVKVDLPLQIVEVDIQDELWSPFPSESSVYNFVDNVEAPAIVIENDSDY